MRERTGVAVVGAGFAGAILARVLARQGWAVTLLERGRHPRFALGESSTPLAALCLERLAARHGLPDLAALAAYGRWLRELPSLRHGLKRGFTFYSHPPDDSWRPGEDLRLLVAASPDDEIADSHWLRADVDHHLVRRAMAEGVDYRDRVELTAVEVGDGGARLRGRHGEADGGRPLELSAAVVVDATGPAGFLARHLPLARSAAGPDTFLVGGHVAGAAPFIDPAASDRDPYPAHRAAVHHLLDVGWLYDLQLDHGVTSAGLVVHRSHLAAVDPRLALRLEQVPPAIAWESLLARHPSLAARFAPARPVVGPFYLERVAHRVAPAAGRRWALLPHALAFLDPMFSTGIAWSLLGVERLALLLARHRAGPGEIADPAALAADLATYARSLEAELGAMEDLIAGAWTAIPDPALLASHSFFYFAAVSWEETLQRLLPERRPPGLEPWFLGAGDARLRAALAESPGRLRRALADGGTAAREAYAVWVAEAIAPRNLAGLADPARGGLYPVDLEELVERAGLLGLEAGEVRGLLPRLRGFGATSS